MPCCKFIAPSLPIRVDQAVMWPYAHATTSGMGISFQYVFHIVIHIETLWQGSLHCAKGRRFAIDHSDRYYLASCRTLD